MKKVKAISIICVILLIITILGACSKNKPVKEETQKGQETTKQEVTTKEAKEPVDIVMWYWDDKQGLWEASLNGGESWEKASGNNVIFEEQAWDTYHDKLITTLSAGAGPDVFQFQPTWVPELVGLDALEPLDEHVKEWEFYDEFSESVLEVGRAGQDKMYAMPNAIVVMYLYCRTDMFKEVGLDLPKTMDDFYDAVKALTRDTDGDGKIDVYSFALRGARGGHDMWAGLTMNCKEGLDYLDKDGKVAFNVPEMIEANEKYINIFKEGYAPPTAPTDGFLECQQNMMSGNVAMLVHHIASADIIINAVGRENVEAVPLPLGKGGRYVPMAPAARGVYAKSENKEVALDFFKWLNSPEAHDKTACMERNGVVEVWKVPFMKSVMNLPKYKEVPFMSISIDSVEDAVMAPVVSNMGVWTEKVWPQTMQRALLGEIDSKQMIEELAKALMN
jgi:multiple sugar transport system substrate-binding protein